MALGPVGRGRKIVTWIAAIIVAKVIFWGVMGMPYGSDDRPTAAPEPLHLPDNYRHSALPPLPPPSTWTPATPEERERILAEREPPPPYP